MKKNVIITVMMFGAIAVTMSGFVSSSSSKENVSFELEKRTQTKTQEVTFKKGKLIEVAFISVKSGKEKQFQEEYFKNVNCPNPIFLKRLDNAVVHFMWNWEEVADS